jgi:ABC-type Fe3+-siderophore transport system permease subunit
VKSSRARIFLLSIVIFSALVIVSIITPSGTGEYGWPVQNLFFNFRLPRTLNAIGIGTALAFSGLLLQTLLQNPLAEPYTLGLSGGATLGAILGIVVFHAPEWVTIGSAFVGCWLTVILILAYHARAQGSSRRSLILFGLMVSLFCGSFVSVIFSVADGGQLQRAMSWMIGSVGDDRGWGGAHVLPLVACMTLFWLGRSQKLDVLLLGEDSARNILGPVKKFEREILFSVSLLTSWAVSACGLIGFVGLLAPQIGFRLFKSRRHKIMIPAVLLLGACLMIAADILGRMIGGNLDIPAGGIVALFGAPFLGWLLIQGAKT